MTRLVIALASGGVIVGLAVAALMFGADEAFFDLRLWFAKHRRPRKP